MMLNQPATNLYDSSLSRPNSTHSSNAINDQLPMPDGVRYLPQPPHMYPHVIRQLRVKARPKHIPLPHRHNISLPLPLRLLARPLTNTQHLNLTLFPPLGNNLLHHGRPNKHSPERLRALP